MRSICSLVFSALVLGLAASELRVDSIRWVPADGAPDRVRLHLSWANAWHTTRSHDAAWLFLRYSGHEASGHVSVPVTLAEKGHGILGGPAGTRLQLAPEGVGLWVIPPPDHQGAMACSVELLLDDAVLKDRVGHELDARWLKALDVEMVLVPEGPFWLGDPSERGAEEGAFHLAGGEGPNPPYRVDREAAGIPIGTGPGALAYSSHPMGYHGDGQGPIPAAWPKGVHGFYCMKYEMRQGEYATFLNDIGADTTHVRSNIGSSDYAEHGGSMRYRDGFFVAEHPERACVFLTWNDQLAFADWACLRPMTEFEFEKACRGPGEPLPLEYPWNTSDRDALLRLLDPTRALVWDGGLQESDFGPLDGGRSGASHYGILDLSGNVWERCITVGDSLGRAFKGTHGDGVLGPSATATNADWPVGDQDAPGIGYRGGAYYGKEEPHGNTNPYSPIGYRTYAGWGGAFRYKTYGGRFVRTVP